MKYSFDERMHIGKLIFTKQLSLNEAALKYDINVYTARDYMRAYRDSDMSGSNSVSSNAIISKSSNDLSYDDYASMSKQQLIDELIKSKANELRAKKGYLVEGGGAEKVFITADNKNSK